MIVKEKPVITSPFGMRTLKGINNGQPHLHAGVDIRAPKDAEIYAPEALYIKRTGKGSYGETFIVAGGADSGRELKFMHIKSLVVTGQKVVNGQIIAISDGSGTNAPHLHFEVWDGDSWDGGKAIDPVASGYIKKYCEA